jgi:CheY-like chemotaxis protein
MFTYRDYNVRSIAIVDDQAKARDSMSEIVTDAELTPYIIDKRINSINDIVELIPYKAQALILDYNLGVSNYASFNGAEAVSELYKKRIPALLVTNYSESEVDHFRIYRNNIPVIYNSGDFNPENIQEGVEFFLDEINEQYSKSRKAYKTLFRIVELDKDRKFAFVVIPSWDPLRTVRVPYEIFGTLQSNIALEERFFAQINIGAENHDELYFTKIQSAEKPTGDYAKLIRG